MRFSCKLKRLILYIFAGVLILAVTGGCGGGGRKGGGGGGDDEVITYTNPLNVSNIGDPFVIYHDKVFYLYATSAGDRGYLYWTSSNMAQWNGGNKLVLDKNVTGWGVANFWAPEVIHYKGLFYMVYSAKDTDGLMKIAIAKSALPSGPFLNHKAPLFEDGQHSYIDGHIFVDDDGKVYLYYSKDCSTNVVNGKPTSQIYVVQLKSDLTGVIGDPVLVATPTQAWELQSGGTLWNEGPFVIKHPTTKKYYLLYSANLYSSRHYSVGYAVASSPMAPIDQWYKFEGNPILKHTMDDPDPAKRVSGPGHCMVLDSPDGKEMFIVYHTHTDPNNPSGNRQVNIDRIYFDDEDLDAQGNPKLKVIGPTRTPQPIPSGIVKK